MIAFGAGVLVVALTGELMTEGLEERSVHWAMSGLFVGEITYILKDTLLDKAADNSPRFEGCSTKDLKAGAAEITETKAEATVSGIAALSIGTSVGAGELDRDEGTWVAPMHTL